MNTSRSNYRDVGVSAASSAHALLWPFVLCLLFSAASGVAHAQNSSDRGAPAESKKGQASASTYARDKIETVNLANGNLTLSIPLASVGGRGAASFAIALSYNSKVWTAQHDREDVSSQHGATVGFALDHYSAMYDKIVDDEPYLMRLGGGWTILTAPGMKGKFIGIDPLTTGCNNYTDGAKDCGFKYALTKLWLTLPDGSQLELRDNATDGAPALTPANGDGYHPLFDRDRGRVWHSFDGSDVTFVRDANDPTVGVGEEFFPGGWVFLADGIRLRVDAGVCSKVVDADGNYITIASASGGSTVYTDELGRQTTLQASGGTVTVTATGYMGAPDRSLTVNTGAIGDNLRADFSALPRPFTTGDALHDWQGNYFEHMITAAHTDLFSDSEGILAYNDAAGEDVGEQTAVTRLNLLDGRSFIFRYNQYGEVSEIVYPGGGVSQVDYQGGVTTICEVRAPVRMTLNRRVSERRTLTDGAGVDASWVYARGFTTVGGTSYPSVSVAAHQGGDAGTLLSSENHIFYALDADYRPCGGSFTGTGNEQWNNAKEFRTETQTGTGTVVNVRNWEQRTTVSWANDVGSSVNAYAQQHGVDVLATDDPRMTWEETTLEDGKKKRVEYTYDDFNNVTSAKEYDFGDTGGSTGVLLRQTFRTFIGDVVPPSNTASYHGYCYTNLDPLDSACGGGLAADVTTIIHQKHLPLSEQVLDGAGNPESYSDREYDSYRGASWNAAPPDVNAGMTGYDGARFSAFDPTRQPRGNVTQTRGWVEGATYAVSYMRYDNSGHVISTKDPNGNVSTISYTDDFGDGTSPGGSVAGLSGATYAFPTVAANALGQTAKTQYDYMLGAATGVKDPNGVVTRTEYDTVGRPVRTTAALGLAEQAVTELIYPTPAENAAKVSRQLDSTRWLASKTSMDGFDRPILTASAEDGQKADAASFTVFTKTIYDALGRIKLTTNPYRSQPATTDGWTRTSYDLAGRVTELASFAGGLSNPPPDAGTSADWTGSVVNSYASEQTTLRDQANKQRRSTVDALGRLKTVDEMYEYPSASVYATTSYDYDARGNLAAVHQGEQTRTFIYDGLSRLKSATDPEVCQQQQSQCAAVPITYEYDLCGNLKKKVDARGIIVQYSYDGLNRVTSRFYTGEAGPPTPNVTYAYDDPSAANSKGRLTSVSSSLSTYAYTAYDALGRVKATTQATGGVTYSMPDYRYDLAGNLISEQYPSGRVIRTEYDAAGRVAGVASQATGLYYAGASATDSQSRIQYAAHGAPLSVRLGNGLWEHTSFNSRLQPTQIGLGTSSVNSSTLQLDYSYGTDEAHNDGDVRSQTVTAVGASSAYVQTYSYDMVNRLQSAEETINSVSNWRQVYSYDRYGNRSLAAGTTLPAQFDETSNPSVSTANNRITSAGYSYDVAGNLLCDPGHQCVQGQSSLTPYFAYDAEGKQTSAGGSTYYAYDGDGRRVEKTVGAVATVFVYDASGRMVAEYGGAQPTTSGASYITQDSLGSTRTVTGQNQEVRGRYDYLPFGEEVYAGRVGYGGAEVRQRFTGKERDSETNLDYFLARYYSSTQGRFTSPDEPLVDQKKGNPQSWNLYAYVKNSPCNNIDPNGKCSVPSGLKPGSVGICIEAFIAAKHVGPGGVGRGNDRSFSGDDKELTSKVRVDLIVTPNPKEHNASITEHTTAGISVVDLPAPVGTLALPGKASTNITGATTDKNDTTTFTTTTTAKNGFQDVPLAGRAAPAGSIDVKLNLVVTKDGHVGVAEGSESKNYPSYAAYSYRYENGKVVTTELFKKTEGELTDLTRAQSPIPKVDPK